MADSGKLQLPGRQSIATNVPGNFELITFEGFETLNTKPQRVAIGDRQMYICKNWMPLGENNLRTLYDVGASIYTAQSGTSVSSFAFANTSSISYSIVTRTDGALVGINTATLSSQVISGAGTITNFSNSPSISQWGNQYILAVANQTNGYFMWDGNAFYQSGSIGPAPIIANAGLGYTSSPSIRSVGGSGTGATFNTTIQNGSLLTLTVATPGSGYVSGDQVYLAFSSGGIQEFSAIAFAQMSGDRVGAVTLASGTGGLGYSPATVQVSLQGGGGFGATVTAQMGASGGALTGFFMTNLGQGYTTAPTVVITDVFNAVAQATVNTMPFGVKGTAIETFQGRVWIANGPNIAFSAPGFPDNYDVRDGAGSFQSTDSFLRTSFTQLKQTNGFLYLIGDSSVNYISSVSTSGSPPITTFNNQNVDPQIGTQYANTLQVFSRSIVLANSWGIHSLDGGAVRKRSGELDGIYTTVQPSAFTITPSGAVANVFGIHTYMTLWPIIDQVTGVQTNELMMWDGKRWWTADQSVSLKYISSQEINSVLTAYGTDGQSIYPLFQTPSRLITKTVQSKWFPQPTYIMVKKANRVSGILKSIAPYNAVMNITLDSEKGSDFVQANDQGVVVWTTASGNSASWTTASGNAVLWLAPQTGLFSLPCSLNGSLMGVTCQTTTPDCVLVSVSIAAQQFTLTI